MIKHFFYITICVLSFFFTHTQPIVILTSMALQGDLLPLIWSLLQSLWIWWYSRPKITSTKLQRCSSFTDLLPVLTLTPHLDIYLTPTTRVCTVWTFLFIEDEGGGGAFEHSGFLSWLYCTWEKPLVTFHFSISSSPDFPTTQASACSNFFF